MKLTPLQAVVVQDALPSDSRVIPGPEALRGEEFHRFRYGHLIVKDEIAEALAFVMKNGVTAGSLIEAGLCLVRSEALEHEQSGYRDVRYLEDEKDRDGHAPCLIRLEGGDLLERSKILARYAQHEGALFLDLDRLGQLASQARMGGVSRT